MNLRKKPEKTHLTLLQETIDKIPTTKKEERIRNVLWKSYGKARQKITDFRLAPGNFEMALEYAMQVHHKEKRESGLPYFTHLLTTTGIIMEHGIPDRATHIAAILHDTIERRVDQLKEKARKEKRDLTTEEIAKTMLKEYKHIKIKFGRTVADTVLEVTKDPVTEEFHLKTDRGFQVKMADRYHNLTYFNSPRRQRQYLQRTVELLNKYEFQENKRQFSKAHPKLFKSLISQYNTRAENVHMPFITPKKLYPKN